MTIHGVAVKRNPDRTKQALTDSIARAIGVPPPKSSAGASVDSRFLQVIYEQLASSGLKGSNAPDRYRELANHLGLAPDPIWETSEDTPSKGGSTITTRAFSQILSALTQRPRCFILAQSDGELGSAYERDYKRHYRYGKKVPGRLAFNDAGPGSQIIYYATGNNSFLPKTHFAAARVADILGTPQSDTWTARLSDFVEFDTPLPLADVDIEGRSIQHSFVEISFDTYREILAAAGVPLTNILYGSNTLTSINPRELNNSNATPEFLNDDNVQQMPPLEEIEIEFQIPDRLFVQDLDSSNLKNSSTGYLPKSSLNPAKASHPQRNRNPAERKFTEDRAVAIARKSLQQQGWEEVGDRQLDGVGYDLDFHDGEREVHVEVKGISGPNLRFELTRKELHMAKTDECWVLVAVTRARTRNPCLHILNRQQVLDSGPEPTSYGVWID